MTSGGLLPSPEERDLNQRLKAEHFEYLKSDPNWSPKELSRVPRLLIRLHNRSASRLPMTNPFGWAEGMTWADEQERERIAELPAVDQTAAKAMHMRAIYYRIFRTTKPPGWADPVVDSSNDNFPGR